MNQEVERVAAAAQASLRERDAGIAILAAAMALPGVASAEAAPEQGLVGFKHLYYRESRGWTGTLSSPTAYDPRNDPLTINAPSFFLLTPIGKDWSLEGSIVVDSLSGATPRFHSAISGASRMSEERTAGDLKLTRHYRRAAAGMALAYSTENDYDSTAVSFDIRSSTEDNNTTLALGFGYASDTIKPNRGSALLREDSKKTKDFMVGWTQVMTRNDIIQLNYTYASGSGYFTDPYKFLDNRPRERSQSAFLVRWNHHFAGPGSTLRSSYRRYSDSFDVQGDTFGFEYVQPLKSLTLTPSVRFHSQSAARFYVDPNPGSAIPPVVSLNPPFYSADSRLSAFGGITLGLKVSVPFAKVWAFDAKVDVLEQRSEWRLGGEGSPGLAPFRAQFLQVGIYRKF